MKKNNWKIDDNLSYTLSDMLYVEWKYFNFVSKDLMGLVSYSIGDPRNLSKHGKGLIYLLVFTPEKSFFDEVEIPLSDCRYTGKGPDISMGDNVIKTTDEGIRIVGKGDKISWDLLFDGEESVQHHHTKMKSVLYPKSWLDWMIFLPNAEVTGVIKLLDSGRDIKVNCRGYHDGNRFKCTPFVPLWKTLIYLSYDSKENISFSAATSSKNESGDLFIFFPDRSVRIPYEKFKFYSPSTTVKTQHPIELKARDDDIELNVRIKKVSNTPLIIDFPLILPSFVINEQISVFDVTLRERGEVIYRDKGKKGFAEFTSRKWI